MPVYSHRRIKTVGFQNFGSWIMLTCLGVLPPRPTLAQVPGAAANENAASVRNSASTFATAASSSIVRDPQTGRWYRQQLVAVPVTTTKWESKPVTQRIYEPQVITSNLPVREDLFVPKTEYVWKAQTRGRLNPFRPTTTTFEYGPVTHWVAANKTYAVPITSQSWNARLQTICIYEPVVATEMKQQLVLTEIPAPSTAGLPSGSNTPLVAQPRSLINLPLLANRWSAAVPAQRTEAPSSSILPALSAEQAGRFPTSPSANSS